MKLSRRDLVWLSGGAAVGALASRFPLSRLLPASPSDVERLAAGRRRGEESFVTSTCLLCPGACGINVRKVDGRVVRILGNPLHPVSRGGVCPKGISGSQILYHPDRIKRPLKRVGKRGEGKFEPIEWDAALGLVAGKLAELRRRAPESVALFDGSYPGSMTRLLDRFCRTYGTPNHFRDVAVDGNELAMELMLGQKRLPAWDLSRSRYILSFGTALLDSWWSPVWAARSYGDLHQSRVDVRGELVQLDSRQSTTAAKADHWITVRPGSYGAVALAIAHVILKENLYDEEFVLEHTDGFEAWKKYVIDEVSLDRVSVRSGVDVATLIRTAKEFARKRPAIAIADQTATEGPDGVASAMAIYALNVLVGSVEGPGGVLLAPPVPGAELPAPAKDAIAASALARPRIDAPPEDSPFARNSVVRGVEAIEKKAPYPIDLLLLYHSNPLYSIPEPERVRRAFENVSMIVSFSPFLDETSRSADLILPESTFLERWDDVEHPAVFPHPTYGVVQPVVAPLFQTRSTGDVVLDLARRLGEPLAASFPWPAYLDFIQARARGLFDARRGTTFTEAFEQSQVRLFEESGFWIPAHPDFESFWKKLVETGGWIDPVYHAEEWGRVLRTASRKIEMSSDGKGEGSSSMGGKPRRENGESHPRGIWAPHLVPFSPVPLSGKNEKTDKPDEAESRELRLVVFDPLTLASGTLALIPWMHEIIGSHVGVMWESWVEIDPETAKSHGVADGDRVTLTTSAGSATVRAKIAPGAQGVLHIPAGLGHRALGRYADGIGSNTNDLVSLGPVGPLGAPRRVVAVRISKGVAHA